MDVNGIDKPAYNWRGPHLVSGWVWMGLSGPYACCGRACLSGARRNLIYIRSQPHNAKEFHEISTAEYISLASGRAPPTAKQWQFDAIRQHSSSIPEFTYLNFVDQINKPAFWTLRTRVISLPVKVNLIQCQNQNGLLQISGPKNSRCIVAGIAWHCMALHGIASSNWFASWDLGPRQWQSSANCSKVEAVKTVSGCRCSSKDSRTGLLANQFCQPTGRTKLTKPHQNYAKLCSLVFVQQS